MQKYSDVIQDRNGNVISSAVITVTDYPSGTLSSVYAQDFAAGGVVNPITANNDGEWFFYSDPGAYSFSIAKSGIVTKVTSNVVIDGATSGVLSVNTTAVGNVGAGTDDLMTYTLPANSLSANNKGVRVTHFGTTAANANLKTLGSLFGSDALFTALDITIGGSFTGVINWIIETQIFRTGSGAQRYVSKLNAAQGNNTVAFRVNQGTLAQTDTAAITIKCTGSATADNDIVQTGMIVEFIN